MKQFTTITSTCLPLRTENIDTDQIIPARFLKTTLREGLGKYLFYNWRFNNKDKELQSQFNNSNYQTAKIIVAGNNFGCGSSREHAVWALLDFGFKVIISSSFGDIFYNNSLKNGLLPVVLKPAELEELLTVIEKQPDTLVTVDLENETVTIAGLNKEYHFPIDSFRKTCLLKGVNELGYILSFKEKIKSFEKDHQSLITR